MSYHGQVQISNEKYHAAAGVSKSKLDEFAISPRHYWLKYENPGRKEVEQSDVMKIGAASHCAVIEPDLFTSLYVCKPSDAPRRPTKAQIKAKAPSDETKFAIDYWKAFDFENGSKTILTTEQYFDCLDLRDCVWADSNAASLLRDGAAEQSYFTQDAETGLMLKCRPDFLTTSGVLVDLKFVRDASPFGFGRACAQHRYDVQSAFYPDVLNMLYGGFEQPTFAFIAVEKNEHGPVCAIYFADQEMIAAGRRKWRRELASLARCYEYNNWPGYTPEPQPVLFPKYAME